MILDIVLSKVVYLSECVFWFVSRLCCLCLLLTRIYFHRLLRRILVAWEWVIRVHHVSLCLRWVGARLTLIKCLGVRRSILNFLASMNVGRGGGGSWGVWGLGVCLSACVVCSCLFVCLWVLLVILLSGVSLCVYVFRNLCVNGAILLCVWLHRDSWVCRLWLCKYVCLLWLFAVCLYLCLNSGLVCISKNSRCEYWLVLLVCFSLFPILVGVCVCVVSLCKEGVCMLDWS